MKVTNLRRKLAAALVAGGMIVPAAAVAADLDTNLVTNADFENVDLGDTGNYDGPRVLGWSGQAVFTYTHAGSGGQGADYAKGGPLASGGQYYFTSNNGDPDILAPGVVFQDIDVSTGASATLIAAGNAAYGLSGFFSTYLNDDDWGNIQLDFLDSGSTSLGTADLSPGENTGWIELSTGGPIPVGTQTVKVSLYASEGNDGYIDNMDFQVTEEIILPALDLRVDRDDGSLILTNQTGSPINISGYQLTSAFGALDASNWVSITDNYDADSGGTVDGTNDWTELSQVGAHGDLSEADLESGAGGSLAHTQSINLGNAGTWIRNPNEDLVFQYISNGSTVSGIVNFEDAASFVSGDVDTDGDIDTDDWTIVRSNQHTDLAGNSLAQAYRLGDLTGDLANNHADFAAFKGAFDAANGSGSFVAMLNASSNVPEPTSIVLFVAAGLFVAPAFRRSNR